VFFVSFVFGMKNLIHKKIKKCQYWERVSLVVAFSVKKHIRRRFTNSRGESEMKLLKEFFQIINIIVFVMLPAMTRTKS